MHADSQQRPSLQKPLVHWWLPSESTVSPAHTAPVAFLPEQVPLLLAVQYVVLTHCVSALQVVGHPVSVPLQR